MEKRKIKKLKPYISPEHEKLLEREREARNKERFRIARCMITHNEPDEKISLYTCLTLEELKNLREYMLEEPKRKTEAMRRGLSFQD